MNTIIRSFLIAVAFAFLILAVVPWMVYLVEKYWKWCDEIQRKWKSK